MSHFMFGFCPWNVLSTCFCTSTSSTLLLENVLQRDADAEPGWAGRSGTGGGVRGQQVTCRTGEGAEPGPWKMFSLDLRARVAKFLCR